MKTPVVTSRASRHECAQCLEVRPCGWKVCKGGRVRWLCSITASRRGRTTLLVMAGGHLPRESGR